MYSLQTYICPSEAVQEKNCFVFTEEWKLCLNLIEYIALKMSALQTTGALWGTRGIQS